MLRYRESKSKGIAGFLLDLPHLSLLKNIEMGFEINRIKVNGTTIVHEYHRHYNKDGSIDIVPNERYRWWKARAYKLEQLEPFEISDRRINDIEKKEEGLFADLKERVRNLRTKGKEAI